MDYTALKSELLTDPAKVGYASYMPAGMPANTAAIANLLNAATGPGAGVVALATIDHDDFVADILPAVLTTLPTLSTALQTKWNTILAQFSTSSEVLLTNATTQTLLSGAVTDGLATQAQVTAWTTRAGSRAEVLFGAGTVAAQSDVMAALGVN